MKLTDVDRTRAFTPAEQTIVNEMAYQERYTFMARPNSAKTMTAEERAKHYVSANYPVIKYGPNWTLTPPKSKK